MDHKIQNAPKKLWNNSIPNENTNKRYGLTLFQRGANVIRPSTVGVDQCSLGLQMNVGTFSSCGGSLSLLWLSF